MKIMIIGATGFIGRELIRELLAGGHVPVAVSRNAGKAKEIFGNEIPFVEWDGNSSQDLAGQLEGMDAIVNLAGESIAGGIWTEKRKKLIRESRVRTGRILSEAIGLSPQRISVFVQGSATGFYGADVNDVTDETAPTGKGFLAELTKEWEESVMPASKLAGRMIFVRTGLVLGKNGGLLEKMLLPFRFYSGTVLGSGRQWMPWIHIRDEVRAIRYLLENQKCSGTYNLTAPAPVTMKDFIGSLAKVTGKPAWMKVPAWALKAALGEMAVETILGSQNVYPGKLLQEGFRFEFEKLDNALIDLLKD